MARNSTDFVGSLERRTIHVIHYNLSYVVHGAEYGTDGAIVLLHDFPAGAFAWDSVLPLLTGLQRAVYAIDMLGYGQSDHPWPADTSVWGQADVLTFLLEKLNLTNIVLVGHGFGGAVAQILATRLIRERVAALVLIDTLCYLHAFSPDWPLPDMKKLQDIDTPKHITVEELLHQMRETLPKGTQNPKGFADIIDKYLQPWNSELGKEVLLQHVRLLLPHYVNSVSSDLQGLGKPALIVWGEQDQQVPVHYAERLHREMAGSQLVTIPNAGHLVLFDAPNAVTEALVNFVKNL
jgi:pimeloyl-ACP methyl ester carboxylesterase